LVATIAAVGIHCSVHPALHHISLSSERTR
jgi:hypothetical protein